MFEWLFKKKDNRCENCLLLVKNLIDISITDEQIERFAIGFSQSEHYKTVQKILERKKEYIKSKLLDKLDMESTSFNRGFYRGLNYLLYVVNYSITSVKIKEQEEKNATTQRNEQGNDKQEYRGTADELQEKREHWNEPPSIA